MKTYTSTLTFGTIVKNTYFVLDQFTLSWYDFLCKTRNYKNTTKNSPHSKPYYEPFMKKILPLVLLLCIASLFSTDAFAQKKKKKRQITVPGIYRVDSDGDSVPDVRDQCPGTPKGTTVDEFGCPPDRDNDGVYDYEDECPDTPGPAANKGCPWGDRDKDGITDNEDKCPDTPGVPEYQGCPVPDQDGDGVVDPEDLCVDVPGTKKNRGCPEVINKEEEEVLEQASKVEFAYNRWEIKPTWYEALDKVAAIMQKYPKASLLLEGHTDNVGDDANNLVLSENRAAAVRDYLIGVGIPAQRIESKGYGEAQPIDSNATKAGRQRNRRVKMTVFVKGR